MTHPLIKVTAPLALSVAIAGSAFAKNDDQENIRLCRAALLTQMPTITQSADFKFKSIRGNRIRQLTFEYKIEGDKQKVVCKVKRGELIDLEWKNI